MTKQRKAGTLLMGLFLAGQASQAFASDDEHHHPYRGHHGHRRQSSFQRVGTFANYANNASIASETVAEIVAATQDGMTLVYTDSPRKEIGFIDITDPSHPIPAGKLAVGGEPTSVEILGNSLALVAVNTRVSFTSVSGKLAVVDMATRTIVASIDLGGQPDSIKLSPDGRYAAVIIENERDEDITVGGVKGGLPQAPAGYLAIIDIVGADPTAWTRRDVSLAGLATYAPEDPEPEFVDVNAANEAVVTMQENNHIAIVDLTSGSVIRHFPAGTVSLTGVDHQEDGLISLTDSIAAIPREPDAVTWVPGDRRGEFLIATANEGDLFGGSRGFTLFRKNGRVVFDSASTLEELAVRMGHYPEDRSENKGTEPEAIEFGRFGRMDYLFVGSERGSFIAVYEMADGRPNFKQILPAPLGPEGLLAIPSRNLLIASGENDDPSYGVRSSVMIYELQSGKPSYPQILSADDQDKPIAWSALSGMVAVPGEENSLLAVWDSYYSQSRIFRIDTTETPAVITESLPIQGGKGNYDPEGIAIAPDDTLWIASEGNATDSRPNRLIQVDPSGQVLAEIGLPQAILDCRKKSTKRGTLGSGFEGLAVTPAEHGYKLLVAQQRGWDYTTPECEDLDDDAFGLNTRGEPLHTRIWIYDPMAQTWEHITWELSPLPANASWVGLSEITRTAKGDYVLIERDNLTGDFARLKTLVKINRRDLRDRTVLHAEKDVFDLLPALHATHGWITDKPEGVAITERGQVYVVTDNDGVDDWSGETWFLGLGNVRRLFR